MQKTLATKDLTEKALKVFLLHFYSLDWLLPFLLEKRCNRLLAFRSLNTFVDYVENDILLCVREGIQLFPTARGLEVIDHIIRSNDMAFGGGKRAFVYTTFRSLVNCYCAATRYRMSLFAMADRARESHHDDLASLWVIAATAKLDHVSAYQAYAAAKKEEARLLNHMEEAENWKAEKGYVGDLTKVQFDADLVWDQINKEWKDKDQSFRNYLHSKADKSLHEMIDTCDFSDPMFLAIWCNIKSQSSQHEVPSSMWKVASELFRSPDEELAKALVTNTLEIEGIVKRLSRFRYFKNKINPTHSSIWEKAATTVEYALSKIRSITMHLTLTDLRGQMQKLDTLLRTIQDLCITYDYYYNWKWWLSHISEFDSSLKDVDDLLPVLIAHPDHSFPEFNLLLQEKCEQWRNDLERYVEIADAYIRCRIDGDVPSEELLQKVKLSDAERSEQCSLLTDYHRFLKTAKFALDELTKDIKQANEIELKKRDLYAQAVHTFVDSLHAMHVQDGWLADNERDVLEMFDTVFVHIRTISDLSESDINVLIVDVSLQIITLPKNQRPDNKESHVVRLLNKAREALLAGEGYSDSDDEREREQKRPLIETGRRYYEMGRWMLKVEEIKLKVKNDNRDNDLFLRLFACFDLTVKSVLCMEEIADADYHKEQKAIPFRSKADTYQ